MFNLKYEWVVKNKQGQFYNRYTRRFEYELTAFCFFTYYTADKLRSILENVFSVEQYRSSM